MRTGGLAALIAVALAVPAAAEVTFTLVLNGYSKTFRECEFVIEADAPRAIASMVLHYRGTAPGQGVSDCEASWGPDRTWDNACRTDRHLDFRCEDAFTVVPTGLGCFAASGASVDCGPLTLGAPRAGLFVFE